MDGVRLVSLAEQVLLQLARDGQAFQAGPAVTVKTAFELAEQFLVRSDLELRAALKCSPAPEAKSVPPTAKAKGAGDAVPRVGRTA